jgi:transcriptional regulator
MYLPKHFAEPRIEVMHELMRAYPLATLVTFSSSGLDANHIPLQLVADATPFGTLQGHVARANPLWQDFDKNVEVLVIFQGPDAYISPSWYATKKETGKAVPTWNYAVAHAYGTLRIIDDASWLRAQIETLTTHNEAPLPHPWAVTDAPGDYIEKMIAAVVGIEIEITRLNGKWKVSQNQPAENQAGVVEALRDDGNTAMADLVEARAKTADQ